MWNEIFVGTLAVLFFAYLHWGFRVLPGERWQILATLPHRPAGNGEWHGLNLTWYGLLSSIAQIVSIMVAFLLLGAVGVTRSETVLLSLVILGVCIPGSKLVALWVEGKSAVFSVGAAAAIGIVLAPWAILLSNVTLGRWFAHEVPVLPALAAFSTGYAIGEGLGRLACISFGCCYGKALRESHPFVQWLFARWHFVFRGETKKIAYAGKLAGEKVVPIQGVTAVLYTGAGLAGMLFFLHGAYATALLLTLAVTQLWRAFSETLRADWRGAGRFSTYQVLAMLSVLYMAVVLALLPAPPPVSASLLQGLETLWHPGMLLFFIGLWIAIFLFYGRSLVTGSRLSLYVCHDRI